MHRASQPRVFARLVQVVLLAVVAGAPSVWAARRQARGNDAQDFLVATASAHQTVSYAGGVVWSGVIDGTGFGGKSFGGKGFGKRSHGAPAEPTTFGVRHDAQSGKTTYSTDGPWKQWTMPGPSSRMPDPAAWCLAPERMAQNYTAEESGANEFLGRAVRVLRVRSRHEGRPSLEVWADAKTLLPLKVTTYRPDGSVYRVAKFRRVEFGPQPRPREARPWTTRWFGKRVPLGDLERSAEFPPLLPDYVPEGFELVEARVKQWATPHLTLLYSDGVTAFELTQAPLPTPALLEAYHGRHMGERHARRMLDWHMLVARQRLIETGSESEVMGKITCRYRPGKTHSSHDLRVEDLEVKLSARSDIDRDLMLRVLRSLRRP